MKTGSENERFTMMPLQATRDTKSSEITFTSSGITAKTARIGLELIGKTSDLQVTEDRKTCPVCTLSESTKKQIHQASDAMPNGQNLPLDYERYVRTAIREKPSQMEQFIDTMNQYQERLQNPGSAMIRTEELMSKITEFKNLKTTLKTKVPLEEQRRMDRAFFDFMLSICTNRRLDQWPEQIINNAELEQEERFLLAKQMVEGKTFDLVVRHIEKFDLTAQQRQELALLNVQKGEVLSIHIDKFSIQDESVRIQLAMIELDHQECFELVSSHIANYQIQNQEALWAIAQKAVTKSPRFCQYLAQYGIESEERRFELIKESAKRFGANCILEGCTTLDITVDHRKILAKEWTSNPLENKIFSKWALFQFDEETSRQLYHEIAASNPTIIYDNRRSSLAQDERLRQQVPFFQLDERLTRLNSNSELSPAQIQEGLSSILKEFHQLNKQYAIPRSFYECEWSLPTPPLLKLIEKIAKQGTQQDLVSLVTLLQTNFFCATNQLLSGVFFFAKQRYPELNELVTTYSMRDQRVASVSALSAEALVAAKVAKKGLEGIVAHPSVIYINHLQKKIQEFKDSKQQKAVFLINFSEGKQGHYSPLILEKQGAVIKAFNSDSVHTGRMPFTEMIIQKLADLKFMELYVVPKAEERQHDFFSCPIFSIGDISAALTIMSRGESFFDYLLSLGTPQKVQDVYEVHSLPIEMMKMTQSLSRIQQLSSSIFPSKSGSVPIGTYVAEKTYIFYDTAQDKYRRVNATAAMKAGTYFRRILEKCIQEHPKT